jgi:TetR/AcrR family transcriptional regulator
MVQKRLKSDERRQQILSVAVKVFSRKGFGSTTTAAIAEAAGISEPILYRHFKNKRDLFHRLIESVTQNTLKEWESFVPEKGSIKKHLLMMAKNLPEKIETDHLQVALINRAVADAPEDDELKKIMLAHYHSYVLFLEGLISKGIRNKEFRKNLNVQRCAWQLMGPGLAYSATQGLSIDVKLKSLTLASSYEIILNSWE